jgi:hypothetical protein
MVKIMKKTVSFRIDKKLYHEFSVRASVEGMNITEAIIEAVEDWLDKYQDREDLAKLSEKGRFRIEKALRQRKPSS